MHLSLLQIAPSASPPCPVFSETCPLACRLPWSVSVYNSRRRWQLNCFPTAPRGEVPIFLSQKPQCLPGHPHLSLIANKGIALGVVIPPSRFCYLPHRMLHPPTACSVLLPGSGLIRLWPVSPGIIRSGVG